METRQKDNLTDVVDDLSKPQPEPAVEPNNETTDQVISSDGEIVTLGNEEGENKTV